VHQLLNGFFTIVAELLKLPLGAVLVDFNTFYYFLVDVEFHPVVGVSN